MVDDIDEHLMTPTLQHYCKLWYMTMKSIFCSFQVVVVPVSLYHHHHVNVQKRSKEVVLKIPRQVGMLVVQLV